MWKKPYPPRSAPFRIVFCSWVLETTTVRGLFNSTLRKFRGSARWPGPNAPRCESGCSPGAREQGVPGRAADDQVVHARGFGPT
jgi:hypothetical protein